MSRILLICGAIGAIPLGVAAFLTAHELLHRPYDLPPDEFTACRLCNSMNRPRS